MSTNSTRNLILAEYDDEKLEEAIRDYVSMQDNEDVYIAAKNFISKNFDDVKDFIDDSLTTNYKEFAGLYRSVSCIFGSSLPRAKSINTLIKKTSLSPYSMNAISSASVTSWSIDSDIANKFAFIFSNYLKKSTISVILEKALISDDTIDISDFNFDEKEYLVRPGVIKVRTRAISMYFPYHNWNKYILDKDNTVHKDQQFIWINKSNTNINSIKQIANQASSKEIYFVDDISLFLAAIELKNPYLAFKQYLE